MRAIGPHRPSSVRHCMKISEKRCNNIRWHKVIYRLLPNVKSKVIAFIYRLYYNSIFKGALQFHYPLSSGIFSPFGCIFFTQRAALQLALLMFLLPSSPRYQFYTLVRCCTYDTGCFQVVTHPGNNLAQPCLTSVIKWEPVYPWWQVFFCIFVFLLF